MAQRARRRLLLYSDASESAATTQIRLMGPLGSLGCELEHIDAIADRRTKNIDAALSRGYDAVIIQRAIRKRCVIYPRLLDWAREHGVPVIHDTDDLLVHVYPGHPDYAQYQARIMHALRSVVDADVVVTSTAALAEHLTCFHPSIHVIPNELPAVLWKHLWQRPLPELAPNRGLKIGYIGSSTHRADLALIARPLARILERHREKVQFESIGVGVPPELKQLPNVAVSAPPREAAKSYAAFVRYAADLHLDIGIAPLLDNPFNCCKSDIKFQEYSALGIAGIFADLPAYRSRIVHGSNGLLASSEAQWEQHLETLILSAEVRRRLVVNARSELEQSAQHSPTQQHWQELLDQLCDRPAGQTSTELHPAVPVLREIFEYQTHLERRLRRTLGYHVGRTVQRLFRRRAA